MRFDDVAWERSEAIYDVWLENFFDVEIQNSVGKFMTKHRSGLPEILLGPFCGAFNSCLQ
jgi:hypothetical protein